MPRHWASEDHSTTSGWVAKTNCFTRSKVTPPSFAGKEVEDEKEEEEEEEEEEERIRRIETSRKCPRMARKGVAVVTHVFSGEWERKGAAAAEEEEAAAIITTSRCEVYF